MNSTWTKIYFAIPHFNILIQIFSELKNDGQSGILYVSQNSLSLHTVGMYLKRMNGKGSGTKRIEWTNELNGIPSEQRTGQHVETSLEVKFEDELYRSTLNAKANSPVFDRNTRIRATPWTIAIESIHRKRNESPSYDGRNGEPGIFVVYVEYLYFKDSCSHKT